MALQIIDLLSVAHSTSVKHLLMQRQAHELQWTKPCCSMLFEDVFYRGFYIPRNHKIFVSTCWLRILRRIGDVWVVEDGYDRWIHEDETPVSQLLISGTVYSEVSYSGRSIVGSIGHSDLSNSL
ncbi:hypothetical protein F511_18220 [Dorcoceras hygrometricum]|uniref:Uncharacterized protein n=1 Tax=Dorcoceras hygrometricum TaxID=472368 RepID=A0A2Z7BIW8_9LAMI|nr:hypothetical protein F511_18220 [Dorcoceras hygrometricum]